MKTGIELIAQERQKQIDKHGFTDAQSEQNKLENMKEFEVLRIEYRFEKKD